MAARYATAGGHGKRRRVGVVAALLLAGGTTAAEPPGDGVCARRTARCGAPPRFAVLSAFPGELRPLLARATVRETLVVGDRVLRVGTLAGVPVVLGLLGIGLANAQATTELVLDRFDVAGVVVSGVAGAPARIGDVTVPARWRAPDGASFAVDAGLLRLAARVAPRTGLARCAAVPPSPPGATVCLGHEPRVLVGGVGRSDDPFGGRPLPCVPGGDDVFGCDVAAIGLQTEAPVAVDMETAAAARAADARGVPFLAVRAVSDGAGDPLGLPGFPQQFFAWYGLAASNAAATVVALLADAGGARSPGGPGGAAGSPRARSSCRWERRAAPDCRGPRAAPALGARVDRACRLEADAAAAPDAVRRAWLEAAALAGGRTTRRRVGARCAERLEEVLRARAR